MTSVNITQDQYKVTVTKGDTDLVTVTAAGGLTFTQEGTGAVLRTVDSKLKDVISVKDFGAVGDGSTDDATAIQAAVDYSSSSGGKTIHFPAGTYKVNTSINLKNKATLVGDSAEETRVLAGGNFPIFQHLGASGNTVGDVSIRHMQMRGNGVVSSGNFTVGNKSFGIFCDFGGDWLIEDCDFRLCKIGYFQGTSRNNTLSKLDFTLCYDCLYFGPIDVSGGGTPDNTVFIDTIDAAATINCGMRVEGMTGMKIINSSFLQGVEGIYTGDYVPANSPRAILDGNENNVPTVANTRRIRFFHLNNVYTDTILTTAGAGYGVSTVDGSAHTGSGIGYRFMPIANDNPLEDVRLVNCWAGNTDSVTAAMHFKSIVNLHIIGSSIINTLARGILVNGVDNTDHKDDTKNIVINGLVIEDFDRNNGQLSGVEIINADGVAINNISGDADRTGATDTASSYLVKLNNCDRNVISNLTTDERVVLLHDCTQSVVSNCISRITAVDAIAESGSTDKTIITNCITTQAISLLSGNDSIKGDNLAPDKKAETTADGVDVFNRLRALGGSASIHLNTDATGANTSTRAMFGLASTTNTFITGATTNDVVLNTPHRFIVGHGSTEIMAIFDPDGAVELYNDNSLRANTTATGFYVTGNLTCTGNLDLPDDSDILLGDNDEFRIFHDESNGLNYIQAHNNGPLIFKGSSGTLAQMNPGGSVSLRHNSSTKLETTSSGITVTGSVTTQDMNMSNLDGTANEVDGSKGSWSIQEGADDLFLINRVSGKKYKFNLTEIS